METEKEVVVNEPFLAEEKEIEPFDWEDHLYESWLEEQREQKRRRPDDVGFSF